MITSRSLSLLCCLGLSCAPANGASGFLSVHLTWDDAVLARCFVVRATAEGQTPRTTKPILRPEGTGPLEVAIFRDDGPAEVLLEALGYADDACTRPTGEQSEPVTVTYVTRLSAPGIELHVVPVAVVVGSDVDGDGSPTPADCDDGNPLVSPNFSEQCSDTFDNDCDGTIDCDDSDCVGKSCGPGRACRGTSCGEASCGNGVDDDGDGLRDCLDPDCAAQPCGTGICSGPNCVPRTETRCADGLDDDGNGLIDCADPQCSGQSCAGGGICTASGTCGSGWPYLPANFDPGASPVPDGGIVIDCLELVLDTQPTPATMAASGCSAATVLPRPGVVVAGDVLLLSASSLFIDAGARLTVVGTRPVIFAISGDVTIAGELLAAPRASRPGAGADATPACTGGAGASGTAGLDSAPGGSGGAFGSPGGAGGLGSGDAGTAPVATLPVGNASLVPLQGGCSGGAGAGNGGGLAGRGGGGLQISSAGNLVITGLVGAPGEGGGGADVNASGGGGAGSGGAVLLEARSLSLSATGRVLALGGGGGEGSANQAGARGANGSRTDGAVAAGGGGLSSRGGDGGGGASRVVGATGGEAGVQTGLHGGGGGGGAGLGRLRFNVTGACTFAVGSQVSPAPSSADGGCQ